MMKIEEIKSIVEMMSQHDLTEFKIESEEMKLCLKRGSAKEFAAPVVAQAIIPQAGIAPVAAAPAPAPAVAAPAAPAASGAVQTINSPIVGTFYRASSPDADAFVNVGSRVDAETVVCIVDSAYRPLFGKETDYTVSVYTLDEAAFAACQEAEAAKDKTYNMDTLWGYSKSGPKKDAYGSLVKVAEATFTQVEESGEVSNWNLEYAE